MLSSRVALRASRAARVNINTPLIKRNVRFASQNVTPETGAGSGALTGGLAGGGAALLVTYAWYHFSGTKSAVQTAKQAKKYIDSATDTMKVKLEETTPDTNQAIQTLRETANKYASFVPGGRDYVDTAFKDLETVRQKHGGEVDKIVREAYGELRDVSKKGLSLETASDTWNVLSKHIERLASLAGDAGEDILNNHPQLKEKLGGSADQLKQLGERFGPEAKKQVDETWKEINDIAQKGMQSDTVERVWKLVQDKTKKIKQLQEQAFNQGWEQIKPMLDKNPKVKQLVEENMEMLKQGNVSEAVSKVSNAVSTGNTQDLENFMQQAKDKTKQSSSNQLMGWLEMAPDGSQIISKLQKLREVADKQGAQAQELAKETMSELKQVLDKKTAKVENLYESAKKDAEG